MLRLEQFSAMVGICSYLHSLRGDSRVWRIVEESLAPERIAAESDADPEGARLRAADPGVYGQLTRLVNEYPSGELPDDEGLALYTRIWNSVVIGTDPALNVAVFVHGIFSNPESAFGAMEASFHSDAELDGWVFAGFAYDFNEPMQKNGHALYNLLEPLKDMNVHLVCHSMGGLVGRLAVLAGAGKCVRRLFLIGTPNHGAYRTSQLGLLAQATFAVAGKLWGLFPKTGIRDLTRVPEIMREPIRDGAVNARDTDYVTIPGTFFHSERTWWDTPAQGKMQRMFWALDKKMFVLDAALHMTIRQPHDGIVEHASNQLQFDLPGSVTEKQSALIRKSHPDARRYLHLYLDVCDELTHVEIQHHPLIVSLVKSLLLAKSLDQWWNSSSADTFTLKSRPVWDS